MPRASEQVPEVQLRGCFKDKKRDRRASIVRRRLQLFLRADVNGLNQQLRRAGLAQESYVQVQRTHLRLRPYR
jgi:hypothetical protein